MGRAKRKGESGAATTFIPRTRAVKKLQVKHPDFRRLCIFKGIYPRQPHKKLKGRDRSYYHVKDIRYLMHEPLINVFREQKVHQKRLKKAVSKKERRLVERLEDEKPVYALDAILLERFPTFADALRDVDDCLSTLSLFASLAADESTLTSETTAECRRLVTEFEHYAAFTHSVTKVFVSIKGVYLQAVIHGVPVTWLAPHAFVVPVDPDVDFKLLATFVEFYLSLLKFVNFKLFEMSSLEYPPTFSAVALGLAGPVTDRDSREMEQKDESSYASLCRREGAIDEVLSEAAKQRVKLFWGMTFLVGRECPQNLISMLVCNFGGRVVTNEDSESITHVVSDRGAVENQSLSRTYVQPQWVFDCANQLCLLDASPYIPGKKAPPHLSPFVEDSQVGYVPDRALEMEAEKRGVTIDSLKPEESNDEEISSEIDEDIDERPPEIDESVLEFERKVRSELKSHATEEKAPGEKKKAKRAAASKRRREADRTEMAKSMVSRKDQRLIEKSEREKRAMQDAASDLKRKRAEILRKKASSKR